MYCDQSLACVFVSVCVCVCVALSVMCVCLCVASGLVIIGQLDKVITDQACWSWHLCVCV